MPAAWLLRRRLRSAAVRVEQRRGARKPAAAESLCALTVDERTPAPPPNRLCRQQLGRRLDGRCGHALRIYDDRDGFLALRGRPQRADLHRPAHQRRLIGPLRFSAAPSPTRSPRRRTPTWAICTCSPAPAGADGRCRQGRGQRTGDRVRHAGDRRGGNLLGPDVPKTPPSIQANLQMPTTIVLTLDDGTRETFVANDDSRTSQLRHEPAESHRPAVRAPEPVDTAATSGACSTTSTRRRRAVAGEPRRGAPPALTPRARAGEEGIHLSPPGEEKDFTPLPPAGEERQFHLSRSPGEVEREASPGEGTSERNTPARPHPSPRPPAGEGE